MCAWQLPPGSTTGLPCILFEMGQAFLGATGDADFVSAMNPKTQIVGGCSSKIVFRDTDRNIRPRGPEPTRIATQVFDQFVVGTQVHPSTRAYTSNISGPRLRAFTNELTIRRGVVELSKVGMINLEASMRRSSRPADRFFDYYNSYCGIRKQLRRSAALFA
jgi:hypothetical protein